MNNSFFKICSAVPFLSLFYFCTDCNGSQGIKDYNNLSGDKEIVYPAIGANEYIQDRTAVFTPDLKFLTMSGQ